MNNFTLSPALLLDVVLIVLVVLTVRSYHKKGFLAGLLDLVGNLASFVFAWLVSSQLSPIVFEKFFRSGLITATTEKIATDGAQGLQQLIEKLGAFSSLEIVEQALLKAQQALQSNVPDLAEHIVEDIMTPLIVPMITVLAFFVIYIVCRVLIRMLVTMLMQVNRIPILGDANRFLGALIGVLAGLLNALLALCCVWAVIALTGGVIPELNHEVLANSVSYTLFSTYNPFV